MSEKTPKVGDVLWVIYTDEAEPVTVIWVGKQYFNYTREDGTIERCQIRHVGHLPLGGFFKTCDEAYEKKASRLLQNIDTHKAAIAHMQTEYTALLNNWSAKP